MNPRLLKAFVTVSKAGGTERMPRPGANASPAMAVVMPLREAHPPQSPEAEEGVNLFQGCRHCGEDSVARTLFNSTNTLSKTSMVFNSTNSMNKTSMVQLMKMSQSFITVYSAFNTVYTADIYCQPSSQVTK